MVSADRESSVDKYQSAGWHFPVFPQEPAAARQRGIWPCANARAKGCVAVAQGAKAVVGALWEIRDAIMIKPSQPRLRRVEMRRPPLVPYGTTFLPAELGALWMLAIVPHDSTGKHREALFTPPLNRGESGAAG